MSVWHELLSEKKLLQHLSADKPAGTPAHELLAQFLCRSSTAACSSAVSSDCCVGAGVDEQTQEGGDGGRVRGMLWRNLRAISQQARNTAALLYRQLALTLVAHKHWSLIWLDHAPVSLSVQHMLFSTLLSECCDGDGGAISTDICSHASLSCAEWGQLPPHQVFAACMYHRWVLWNCCQIALPSRPRRSLNIPMPGHVDSDAMAAPAHVIECTRQLVEQHSSVALVVLTALSHTAHPPPALVLPSVGNIGKLVDRGGATDNEHNDNEHNDNGVDCGSHRWSAEDVVHSDCWRCQLHFELGRYLFFRGEYDQSGYHFSECQRLLDICTASGLLARTDATSTVSSTCATTSVSANERFLQVDLDQLNGYCLAVGCCSTALSQSAVSLADSASAEQQLNDSLVLGDWPRLLKLLAVGNKQARLSTTARHMVCVELQERRAAMSEAVPSHVVAKVEILNLIGGCVEPACQRVSQVSMLLEQMPHLCDFLLDSMYECICAADSSSSFNIAPQSSVCAEFGWIVRRLCVGAPRLYQAVTSHKLAACLFSAAELLQLAPPSTCQPRVTPTNNDVTSCDYVIQTGALRQQLVQAHCAGHLREALTQLSSVHVQQRASHSLCSGWQLSAELHEQLSAAGSCLSSQLRDYVLIALAKAGHMCKLKCYNVASMLVQSVLKELSSLPPSSTSSLSALQKLINWEQLMLDQLQMISKWPQIGEYSELTARSVACMSPTPHVTASSRLLLHTCTHLLNVCEWQHLATIPAHRRTGSIGVLALLATVCRDLVQNNNNNHNNNGGGLRKSARELWNMVLAIFSSPASCQHKRSASGSSVFVKPPSSLATSVISLTELQQLICHICEHTSVSVLVSLLCRVHNLARDDSTRDICLEHASIWPNVASNVNGLSLKLVSGVVRAVLSRAVFLYPTHIPWLHATADLCFAEDEYSSALCYFLQACMLSSHYFSRPVPRSLLNQQVVGKMVRCCTALQCSTQAALLCQLSDDVDYASAFSLLPERNCRDAMDAYYDSAVWDLAVLEYATHVHHSRGELTRRQRATQTLSQAELNGSNSEEIQREAVRVRRAALLRAMFRHYAL